MPAEPQDYQGLQELRTRKLRARRIDLIFRVYSTLGVLMAVFGTAYFVLTLIPYRPTPAQSIALGIAGFGVALGLMSKTLIVLRRERAAAEAETVTDLTAVAEFLERWAEFENVSRAALAREGGLGSRHSVSELIRRLYQEGRIDDVDRMALERAIQLRNAIVHSGKKVPSPIARKVIQNLTQIILKIAQTLPV
jgi:uncharacterized protein YutE (UPF0331/DUF86 family)